MWEWIGGGSFEFVYLRRPRSLMTAINENQKSQWYNSVPAQRPENQEHWCPRTGEDGYPSLGGEQICSSSAFSFSSHPQWIRWCPPALAESIVTQSTDANAHLFQKPSQTQEIVFYQHPWAQSNLNKKVTIKVDNILKHAGERSLWWKEKIENNYNAPFL